ncbi:uncharacterized protein LOC117589025 [Drosophila guanche]|uniref:uncharacterized protein LOC117589025 n=1 Tax=Drosophila guanche TaxID=7266 RepID=UPI001471056F|nr:uncharacterized protein LOC117589025 [Drosophila guanche]
MVKRVKAHTVSDHHKYVDIYTKIYKFPVDNVTVRSCCCSRIYLLDIHVPAGSSFLQLKLLPMRHDHGYRPFFMNLTFDICAFFRNLQNENGARQLILRELFQTVKPYTNINHTCPYHHDVEVSKLWTGNLEARFLRHLPLPHGDYSLCLSWYTSSVHRATVKVYFRLTDS